VVHSVPGGDELQGLVGGVDEGVRRRIAGSIYNEVAGSHGNRGISVAERSDSRKDQKKLLLVVVTMQR
jgi:hypothetical protein